ncbi:MAG: hypothetical protein CVU71_04210 [Deltaproteobacteria bacterium HGW-Deltaproteobacteria-6]|jgi:hypothetical protein|nr:MAG: hypothetical protein CVU71_04210 [Deltaproteobacteria bacterium HGW-Deltaproteobacteria-6]
MESLFQGTMSIPLYQIVSLLIIMTVTALFGFLKMGLFLSYIFVFYWGNMLNIRSIFGSTDPNDTILSFAFVGFGLIIFLLAMLGFVLNKE